ncbi:uncharacterized protein LOC107644655 [Arachis ipaensis]|uniref:uncharacterized protein LOC107644655 n=1 Tax=Arachis ipaensis TaxID=130454 RepID=UPI0007AF7F87|nr:uncharacterized protein LOC107644655 [Arachis ipaensis]
MKGGYVRGGHSRSHEPPESSRRNREQRSAKKIRKGGEGLDFSGDMSLVPREEDWMVEEREGCPNEEQPTRRSFSEAVKGGKKPVAIEEKESSESSDESDDEEGECLQPEIRVEKLMGRRISLPVLTRRLEAMWGKQGSIEVIDIGNEFFIVKFFSQEDLDYALTGGPWKIFDHYLTLRFWKPDFNPTEATIDTVAAWIRLPGLAIEYYEDKMLKKIGNVIGRTLKVDTNTTDKCRGRFARLCVELDLSQPLISQYSINGVRYLVEYEGIHNICFSCGIVGHEKANCPMKKTGENGGQKVTEEAQREGEIQVNGSGGDTNGRDNMGNANLDKGKSVIDGPEEPFGPWMVVQRGTRGRNAKKG